VNIIAIDPGLKGAISYYCGHTAEVLARPLPLAGKTLDLSTLIKDIQRFDNHDKTIAVIEKVSSMPGQGVASTFTFGCGYGQLQGLLAGLGIPYELVTPQSWKKAILAGTTKDKDAAIAYCRRAFPDVPLIMPRCRKEHDGIADALCLLQYGIRTYAHSSLTAHN
jgi:crossover junction endodeoxyribonuclease RuvC